MVRAQADEQTRERLEKNVINAPTNNVGENLKELGEGEDPFDDDYNPEEKVKEADEPVASDGNPKYPDYDSTYIPP